MSTASNRSYRPNRSINNSTRHGERRERAGSRATSQAVALEDGYTHALRIAFLNYILQPKKKRKEYVAAPKPLPRAHTSSIGDLMKEFIPTGPSTSSLKLPHSFRSSMEKRMEGILRGVERLPGYNDAAVKRTFGEAYTAFTAADFRKSIDKDRKIEPLILIFYSSANKAQGRGKSADDVSWRLLVDRHLALFVRLVSSVIRDNGGDQKYPELMGRFATLEKKLLTNDQDLYLDTGQPGEHKTIEVEIPLSYDVKDMPMVQTAARIFGKTMPAVQSDLEPYLSVWTEEAALKDLKQYQHRLTSNMGGTLRRNDFDVDGAFEEWKKAEIHHLTQMMLDILTARPELAKTSSAGTDRPLPARPVSLYSEDQAYADLGRMISSPDSTPMGFDQALSLSSLSLDDTPSIRSVDEPSYTFIPPDPRSYYKFVLRHAMRHDRMNPEAEAPGPQTELSKPTADFLNEVAVHWRLPQVSRHVLYLELASQMFMDMELDMATEELYEIFEYVKGAPPPEPKKPPYIQLHSYALDGIDRSRWTLQDYSAYQQLLVKLNEAIFRELYDSSETCFDTKPRGVGASLAFLLDHIRPDEAFSQKPEAAAEMTHALVERLRAKASDVYRQYLDTHIPQHQEDWDFSHVVKLGNAVVKLCLKIRKRYTKNPDILGAGPFPTLVATMLPNFEEDAKAIVERVVHVAKDRGLEVNVQDGFDLYKELVEIRKIHVECLPDRPFAFHVEDVLEEFVWRWIKMAEIRMQEFVESAIKQDKFEVRTHNPEGIPTDEERHSVSIIDIFQLFNQTVDQVFQLEWDDDVHHARFMTALSKAFSAGIGHYCEIVEQSFAKEMDRPNKQELEAGIKTTQERFMQYAKDALSTKDRIEPFQFYPISFVKLNNIEYAMQQLDKLEKLVNVDGCAEVIREVDGAPKVVDRRNAKYVFTIKIVEAEDLKACDPTGTSDPYVVLGDEYQKRLAKTRIIMKNLNPRWDESVDIVVQGPLNVIATIWDYDVFGDHDFVGRTSLKLDPVHFSDYLPREFWLDLDTQGRLLLRVSMEGERDDIQFHFGKAFRHLKRTERDMVRKVTDKLVTHINASLSHEALKSLLSRGIASSMAALWQKRMSKPPSITQADIENALQSLFAYFDENFAIMKQTLTDATMVAVMTRLWKEVLMSIENLLVPPLSEKPSTQRPLTQSESDVVYKWLQLLFDFFNAKDDQGEVLGVPADVLKSPKWHELASLNFFYFETTENLIRTSERMAAATAQRTQQQLQSASSHSNRPSASPAYGATLGASSAFASMGTIRRGKSIMMSRNLGTMRRAKEEKRKEAQADPSDDMILRILRMRPEAVGYLKDRHRQKERMAAHQAAALIVRQSVNQAGNSGPAFGGAAYGRNNLPRR